MQQLPDIEKTDSDREVSCLKRTNYIGRRKVCVNLKNDTNNLNVVVYRYRITFDLTDVEFDLKLTQYQSLLAKRVYILSYLDKFFKR